MTLKDTPLGDERYSHSVLGVGAFWDRGRTLPFKALGALWLRRCFGFGAALASALLCVGPRRCYRHWESGIGCALVRERH
ncbi:MAG: hypothetical protein AB7K71_16025, partial [Polyangiaceae bacterium]